MKKAILLISALLSTIMFSDCARDIELTTGKYITDDGLAWVILEDDNQFIFNRHIATGYDPTGTYSTENNELILAVNDKEKYTFEVKETQLIFKNGDMATSLLEKGTIFTLTDDITVEYKKITGEEAYEMMGELTDYILLDVRTDEEYKDSHIEGAILIPDYEIVERAETELPDKEAVILIYCRSGRRSANIANELIGMGYINVYDFGGIIDWGYETVKG